LPRHEQLPVHASPYTCTLVKSPPLTHAIFAQAGGVRHWAPVYPPKHVQTAWVSDPALSVKALLLQLECAGSQFAASHGPMAQRSPDHPPVHMHTPAEHLPFMPHCTVSHASAMENDFSVCARTVFDSHTMMRYPAPPVSAGFMPTPAFVHVQLFVLVMPMAK
jgi:hypothetical protein